MNLRRDIQGMFAYPTLVLFCENKAGIAAAKALIEALPDSGGLNFPLRQDVRMYYRVSSNLHWLCLICRLSCLLDGTTWLLLLLLQATSSARKVLMLSSSTSVCWLYSNLNCILWA